jgi:signal transduction histidine kinase
MFSERIPKTRLHDIGRFLSELNESFSIIMDLEQLKDNFSAKLKELLNTREIYIFLLNPDFNRFLLVESITQSPHDDIASFMASDKLIFWLSVNKTFLHIKEQPQVFAFLGEREQQLLTRMNVSLVYPFIVMNQVRGLVCIGQRANGNYDKTELQQLKVFFDQAGFAFENASLYQLQKDRTRKMYRADRLATLGELAAGAAHEIRNPLTSIRSSIQYLKRKLNDQSDVEMANDLISEVDRINDIIEGMLSFAKPQAPKKENINLKTLLLQTIQLVSNIAIKKGVDISMNYCCKNEDIVADSAQLKQVFLNVLMNAIQASDTDKGIIGISVNDNSALKTYLDKSIHYIIEITDNGKGIEPEYMDKIFDPFFTTKAEGTGLGLSISYGIINRHGGDIELFSGVDKGTSVKIKIPEKFEQ